MSSTKTAIVVLSDPRGGEEGLGRLFNALAAAYDFKQQHQEVQLIFQGTGVRDGLRSGIESEDASIRSGRRASYSQRSASSGSTFIARRAGI
jgi:hypothetical protein